MARISKATVRVERMPSTPVRTQNLVFGSGGGNNACDTIRFKMVGVIPGTFSALCFIHAVPAGFTVGDVPGASASVLPGQSTVIVCDPQCSFFNEPDANLLNRLGWAKYMQPLVANPCQPYDTGLVPQWEVFSLGCAVNPSCS